MSGGTPPAARWTGAMASYQRSFGALCAGTIPALVAAAGLDPGTAAGRPVLDAGTGTGSVAEVLAGYAAEVTAIDNNEDMLAAVGSRLPRVPVLRCSVTELPFEADRFDAVLANFVVNHLDDPRAGMAELIRVLRPGGRLALTIWAAGPSAMKSLWDEMVAAAGAVPPPATDRLPPERDFARTEDGLRQLAEGSGLVGVQVRRLDWTLHIDPADFWAGPAGGVAGIGRLVTAQSSEVRAELKRQYDRLIQPLVRDGQLALPSWALLAAGSKPTDSSPRRAASPPAVSPRRAAWRRRPDR